MEVESAKPIPTHKSRYPPILMKIENRFTSQSFSQASSRTDLHPFQLYQPSAPISQTTGLTGFPNVSCVYVCGNVLPLQWVCKLDCERRIRCHGNGACDGDGAVPGCTGNLNNPLRVSVIDDECRGNRHTVVANVVMAVEVR